MQNITAVFIIAVMFFFFVSCNKNDNMIESFANRAEVPVLITKDVVTMVSDSGVTRYRITTPFWAVYDRAEEPFWNFPQGILFERFDNDLQTDANIVSDRAVYFERKQLWELTGNVKATNIEGEIFETEILFWNQAEETIYSPAKVTITQSDRIIQGFGFESDQTLSRYSLSNVTGIFLFSE